MTNRNCRHSPRNLQRPARLKSVAKAWPGFGLTLLIFAGCALPPAGPNATMDDLASFAENSRPAPPRPVGKNDSTKAITPTATAAATTANRISLQEDPSPEKSLAQISGQEPTASSTVVAPADSLKPSATGSLSATAKSSATVNPSDPASPAQPASGDSARAMQTILAELQTLGTIDKQAQEQLIEDLKKTDPALWPQLLNMFRASLAYRRQLDERVAADNDEEPPASELRIVDSPRKRPPRRAPSPANLVKRAPPARRLAGPLPAERAAEYEQDESSDSANLAAEERVAAVSSAEEQDAIDLVSAENSDPLDESTATTDPSAPLKKHPLNHAKAATKVHTRSSVHKASAHAPIVEREAAVANARTADWKNKLGEAIAALEAETSEPPASAAEAAPHAALRMLYLAEGRKEDAMRAIDGLSPAQQDFWSSQMHGMATLLDAGQQPDAARRAAEASRHLSNAVRRLSESATLAVRNLTFCSEVKGYGAFKAFDKYEFSAGQELVLYAEVDHFKSEQGDKGYRTALKSSYQILDERGARVSEKDFPVKEDFCQNPRRDLSIPFFVWLPQKIYAGRYTLQLTIEDTLSEKIGQSSIEFTIK